MSGSPGEAAGRVVLVTGGARGVGKAITTAFARRGAHVVVNYFHATAEARRLVEQLSGQGASVEAVRASVAVPAQVEAMFTEVERRHGRLDVLVNNAASGALLPLDQLHESHWQRAVDTNLRGSLRCARCAAPIMARGDGGAIVNLSSIGSSLVISDYAAVGTTKAAVEALTRYLAVEYAPDGIRVNTASAGLLDGAVAGLFPGSEHLVDRVREATPLGHRLGREEELAELVVFLASSGSSWITGQTVVADGGLSLGAALLSSRPRPEAPVRPIPLDGAGTGQPRPDGSRTAVATARDERVAVVGIGVVTPGANTPDELWDVLKAGRNVFGRPSLFDVESFHSDDPAAEDRTYSRESGFITDFRPHAGLAAELAAADPTRSRESTTLWLRHCLHSALEHVSRRAGDRHFAAFGYTADGSQDLESHLVLSGYLDRLADHLPGDAVRALRERYDRLGQPPHEFLPHRVGRNAITGLLPEDTELVMVDTACSSSVYAIDLGVKALREGDVEVAVCGGAFAYSARNLVLFSKLQGLSRSGTVRCFDREADGVLFSDGAGVVVLKRLDRARADGDRVLGVIDGIGLSSDGKGKAIYAPNPAGQAIALRRAYHRADTDPADVGWIVAHATGTRAGDSTELTALREVADRGVPALLSSNKAVLGHTGWTAGLVSMSQALTGLDRDDVPVQPYLRDPIPAVTESRFTPPSGQGARTIPRGSDGERRVGVSSFGFGGTDAHLVLAEARAERPRTAGAPVADEDVVVVGWAADLPTGVDPARWLRGAGPPPAASFGADYPVPAWQEVKLPPATVRAMDRTQVMVLRAAAALDAAVRSAMERLHDTAGVVVGHMGPTRRAVHYALRCYLGDLDRALAEWSAPEAGLRGSLDRLGVEVRSLVPPATEDSFPGIMPNIIASRLASAWDFHGLNATVDGGPDSGLDALRAAERYLRHGDLDLAVVAGVNGNTTDEFRRVLASGGETRAPAEGAFMLVLARESTARSQSLPVLARLRTRFGATDPATRPREHPPLVGSDRTYLGADPLVAVLAHLARGCGTTTVGATGASGPQADLTVPPVLTRSVPRLRACAPRQVRTTLPAVPPASLLLASEPVLLEGVTVPDDVHVVIAPPAKRAPLSEADLDALLPARDVPLEHIRVLARLHADDVDPDDLSALGGLRGLHDLAFLAAKRWRATADSSYAVLLTDAVRTDVPHPATGPFTGLVKALAREAPQASVFAVATDVHDTVAALDLLGRETPRAHDLAVVVHASGRRMEYRPEPAPAHPPDSPVAEGGVIVAAGGTRGLTARVLAKLVDETKPAALYLLGRHAPEAADLPARAAFLTEQRGLHPDRTVGELSAEYDRLVAGADVRRTVRDLGERCGEDRVRFLSCDLTDPEQTRAAIDTIFAEHAHVDLLINAAGTHSGGRVATTALATMRGVRDTKILAYLNLRAALADRRPARWLNVGSLLAVLGWPGEADYCSANDVLGAAAHWQAAVRGGHEATFASPLWDESGFAAEPVMRDLLRREGALTGVSDREGVELVMGELRRGLPDPEVTYLGAAEKRLLATSRRHTVELEPAADGRRLAWRPRLELDGYLRHHRLHGLPTLPGAWIAELAVAAGLRDGRDDTPVEVTNLVFHAPVRLSEQSDRSYHVDVSQDVGGVTRVRVLGDIVVPDGRVVRHDRPHAEAVVHFAGRHPVPGAAHHRPAGELPETDFRYASTGPVALAGPFACLAGVRAGEERAAASFRPRLDGWTERLAGLHLPVLLIDALIQCSLIARRAPAGNAELPIPTAVERVVLFTGENDVELLARHGAGVTVVADADGATALAPDGTPLVALAGVRATDTAPRGKELDRVTG